MTTDTFSCCCRKPQCPQALEFNQAYKKVEYDALLAAEIGQALLQEKNNIERAFSANDEGEEDDDDDENEHNQVQYNSYRESFHQLKQLRWEKQQSDDMIQLLQAEVKSMQHNSNEMLLQIEYYQEQIEKKKLVEKLLALKNEIEQELKTQISDLKQEIHQLQRSENTIGAKYRHLESNHETLQLTHEALSREHDLLLDSAKLRKVITPPLTGLMIDTKFPLSPPLSTTNNTCTDNIIPEMPNNSLCREGREVPKFRMAVTNSNKDPLDILESVTQQIFAKINATDTRVLNRRLKRVFDISELSDMSNSILSSILVDLSEFKSQFDWVHDYDHVEQFFPLVITIRDLLQEIGTIKMTLNDLQADYVKRIERLTTCQYSTHPIIQQHLKIQEQSTHSNKNGFMQGLLSLFSHYG